MAEEERRELRPATRSDIQPGSTIFVLGREALVDSVDWPNVFYKFTDRPGLKNRSFGAWPAAFEVEANPEPEEFQFAVSSMDESDDDEVQHDFEGEGSPSPDSGAPRADASDPGGAQGEQGEIKSAGGRESAPRAAIVENMRRALGSRQTREEVVGAANEDSMVRRVHDGQGVLVKQCLNACAAVTIMECTNVTVTCADRVLGPVEVFRCTNATVRARAKTFRIERSKETCVDVCDSAEGREAAEGALPNAPWSVYTTQCFDTAVAVIGDPDQPHGARTPIEEPKDDEGGDGRQDQGKEEEEEEEGEADADEDEDVEGGASALSDSDLRTPRGGCVFVTRMRAADGGLDTFRVNGYGDDVNL